MIKKSGYIMPMSLAFIAVLMMMATYIASRSQLFYPQAVAEYGSKQAYLIALSGVEITRAQLYEIFNPKKEEAGQQSNAPQEKKDNANEGKKALKKIVARINRWVTQTLSSKIDGVDGSISSYLSCEEGKLPINSFWQIKDEQLTLVQETSTGPLLNDLFGLIQKKKRGAVSFDALFAMMQQRNYILNDVSELLLTEEFALFKNYMIPSPNDALQDEQLYLYDLFTIVPIGPTMNAWLLSKSWQHALQLTVTDKANAAQEAIDTFKGGDTINQQVWDTTFVPVYEKNFNSLPKGIDSLLRASSGLTWFSVISHGKTGRQQQSVMALLEVVSTDPKQKDAQKEIIVRKLYWL